MDPHPVLVLIGAAPAIGRGGVIVAELCHAGWGALAAIGKAYPAATGAWVRRMRVGEVAGAGAASANHLSLQQEKAPPKRGRECLGRADAADNKRSFCRRLFQQFPHDPARLYHGQEAPISQPDDAARRLADNFRPAHGRRVQRCNLRWSDSDLATVDPGQQNHDDE